MARTSRHFSLNWLGLRALLLGFALLGACRAGGPGSPVRTVPAFFNKYKDRSGFKTAEWSADLLQRLALVRVGKLLGGSELTNAITSIRTARVLSFVPTSSDARDLVRQGLLEEADGVLKAERYEPLRTGNGLGPADFRYVVRPSSGGDRVKEFVAVGVVPDAAGSFALAQVEGDFTRGQIEALSKVLPDIVKQTSGGGK